MQVVGGRQAREQARGMRGIAHDLVDVDHRVERARGADPLVDALRKASLSGVS